jgi:hypothetical protein
MKVKNTKTLKNGKRHLLVELDPDEELLALKGDEHYRIGYPIEDVMRGHILIESQHVTWCSLEQKWLT